MDELRASLYWLMGLRVVVVTLLLGLSITFQVAKGERVPTFYALIVFTYAITIAYTATLSYLTTPTALTRFAYFQIPVDLLLETGLVAMPGGSSSPVGLACTILA